MARRQIGRPARRQQGTGPDPKHHHPAPVTVRNGRVRSLELVMAPYRKNKADTMIFEPPEGEPVHIVCYRSGGASIRAGEQWFWCGSTKKKAWCEGADAEPHAQFFPTVERALMFARGAGWIGE